MVNGASLSLPLFMKLFPSISGRKSLATSRPFLGFLTTFISDAFTGEGMVTLKMLP